MQKLRNALGALILPLLLVAVLLVYARPQAADAQSGITNFDTVVLSGDLIVGDDATVGGDLTLTGDTTLSGESMVTALTVSGFMTLDPSPTISLTVNGWVTPTTSFQPLESAGAVATSGARIAVQPAGATLVLLNVGAQTITFTETGTLVSAGNIALGAGDSATLISNGTNWYQIGASNN